MPPDVARSRADSDQMYADAAGAPPAEALRAVRAAGAVARRLHDSGRQLRFSLVPSADRVEVLLCDDAGIVLARVTPSRAVEVAMGDAA